MEWLRTMNGAVAVIYLVVMCVTHDPVVGIGAIWCLLVYLNFDRLERDMVEYDEE